MAEATNSTDVFIKESSPDGGFLQSDEWRKFQESVGRKTFHISDDNFHANIIEHQLPIVGKYFYIPRGPIISCNIQHGTWNNSINELIDLAKKNNIGWIRIEPADEDILEVIKEYIRPRRTGLKIQKAPHDMQPGEILVMDITKPEEELLAEMKAKTRYNIRLAEKKGVQIRITNYESGIKNNDINKFINLVRITAKRDKITPHPKSYYRKMFETIPGDILKLYIAEYENKIIAANIMIFYGNTATYLHGASDNEYRNVMAPYLLQWQAILDAKKAGLTKYDMGGVKIPHPPTPSPNSGRGCSDGYIRAGEGKNWQGITKFKTGFAPDTKPVKFPGSYDIIMDRRKYFLYKFIRKFIP